MNPWLVGVLGFVLGLAVGAGVMALRRRSSETEQRFRRLRREFDQYQSDVALHFSQAAEALTRLRSGFDQLYQEIQGSAGNLVGEESWQRRLRQLEPNGPGAAEERRGASGPPVAEGEVRGARAPGRVGTDGPEEASGPEADERVPGGDQPDEDGDGGHPERNAGAEVPRQG